MSRLSDWKDQCTVEIQGLVGLKKYSKTILGDDKN